MLRKHLPTALALSLFTVGCGDDGGGSGEAGTDTDASTTAPSSTSPTTDPSTSTTDDSATTDPSDSDSTTSTTTNPTTTDATTTGPDTDTDPTVGETDVPGEASYYRLNSVAVRDPHFFDPLGLGMDVTQSNVNDELTAALAEDLLPEGAPDGFLDLGFVLKFQPLDQGGTMEPFAYYNAQCTAPVDSTTCDILPTTVEYPTDYSTMAAGDCYVPNPANVSTYPDQPGPPEATSAPCFITTASSVSIQTASFTLPIANATVSAQFVGDPAMNLVSGNIEGFVSAADAMTTIVETGLTGPRPLEQLLRAEDMDGDGWVFHIAFTAVPVDWTGA